jgi:hypothetical protein
MDLAVAMTPPPLSSWDRTRALTCVAACAAVILAGPARWFLVPQDPEGCVSVLTCRQGWLVIPLFAALAFLLAAAVTRLGGSKLEDLGLLAVGVGLAIAAMPHGNSGVLWLELGRGQDRLRASLAAWLTVETAAWLAVMFMAWLGCRWAGRGMEGSGSLDPRREIQRGLVTMIVMCVIAGVLIPVLSGGTELTVVDTGQVYFSVAAAFYLGSLLSYQLSGAQSPVWAYGSVAIVALGGLMWTILNPAAEFPGRQISHFMQIPPSDYARPLPLQIVAAGMAAAIAGYWQQRTITSYALQESDGSSAERAPLRASP